MTSRSSLYYVVQAASGNEAPHELGSQYSGDYGRWLEIQQHLALGLAVTESVSEFVIELSKLKEVNDLWWFGNRLLVSRHTMGILRDLGEKHFQEWPVTLATRSGKCDRDSTVLLNLIDKVDCMDKKRSKATFDMSGLIKQLDCLVLDAHAIPSDRHLFRTEQLITLASTAFVERWQAAKLRGTKFILPEDYQD